MIEGTQVLQKDKLEELLRMQFMFGRKFTSFPALGNRERQIKTLEFINHAIEELIEMRRELPIRKHWSTKKDNIPDWDKVKEEYVDALHFFLSLALINGWSADDIFDGYCEKNKVNIERQNTGY